MRAQVVLLDGDRILMACHEREGRRYWVLPGGAIEAGETPEQAAVRELREESGLDIHLERLLFVDGPRAGSVPVNSPRFTFLAQYLGDALSPTAEGTMVGLEWLPVEWPEYDASTRETMALVRAALNDGSQK